MMITLYSTPGSWGLPSISPFCVKLETYLRMTKLEYQIRGGNPMKAPKGRVPYIKLDGKLIGDSTLIIRSLKERFGDPLDQGLSAEQKALALALQRMVENHLYYGLAYLRWTGEKSWPHVHKYFKTLMPPVIGGLIVKMIKRDMISGMNAQGVADFTEQEIIDFSQADIGALSSYLGSKNFFLGDQPTSVDAAMYGFLIQLMWVPWDCPVKEFTLSQKNLVSYCERMKQKYWS